MHKHIASLVLALVLLISLIGCTRDDVSSSTTKDQITKDQQSIGEEQQTTNQANLLVEGFEGGTIQSVLDNGLGFHVASPERVEFVRSPTRAGMYALKLTVKPEDVAEKKNRAEIKYDIPQAIEQTSEMWYSWSFMIQKDFAEHAKDSGAFNMIAQWLDLPTQLEENNNRGPAISMSYGTINGESGISFIYGLKGDNIKKGDRSVGQAYINKGEWVDVAVHIKRSQGSEGFIEVWINGESITHGKVYGPNVYSWDVKHVFKTGLYRGQVGKAATTNSIYIDNLRVGISPTTSSAS